MTKVTITIECENAAFTGDPGTEVARILKKLAEKFIYGYDGGKIMDYNGNSVGKVDIDL